MAAVGHQHINTKQRPGHTKCLFDLHAGTTRTQYESFSGFTRPIFSNVTRYFCDREGVAFFTAYLGLLQ